MEEMKRRFLIAIVVSLLLISEGLVLLKKEAKAQSLPQPVSAGLTLKPISAGVILASSSASILKLQELSFYYRQDEAVRYLGLKNQREHELNRPLPISEVLNLSRKAYKASNIETPLDHWRKQGGPYPRSFSAKIHLYNQSTKAVVEAPMKVTLKAKMGVLQADPTLHLTDYETLERTAKWVTIHQTKVPLSALAPGMDKQFDLLEFEMLPFLAANPGKWPLEMEVSVKVLDLPLAKQKISLIPDHFIPLPGDI
jgi:hypothetical protein